MKVFFDPTKDSLLARNQRELADNLHKHFKRLRSDVTASEPWQSIQSDLQRVLEFTSRESYRLGALEVGRSPKSSDYIRLRIESMARGSWVTNEMTGYTHRSLGIVASKKTKLLSGDRANKVAVYESRRSAFSGKTLGWMLNKAARKEWFVSDAHDQDDLCDDNEDDGVIDMDDAFTSGDMYPPGHINCLCSLWLHL